MIMPASEHPDDACLKCLFALFLPSLPNGELKSCGSTKLAIHISYLAVPIEDDSNSRAYEDPFGLSNSAIRFLSQRSFQCRLLAAKHRT